MSMSPWKGWSANDRSVRVDGVASPQRERGGGAAESQNPGHVQPPAYGSPVAWQGWSALRQEPGPVAPTAWTGWTLGLGSSGVAIQSTPEDRNPGNPLKPALLEGAAAPTAPSPAVAVSIHEAAACVVREGALGKRAVADERVPSLSRAGEWPTRGKDGTLAEAVARARAGRKFLRVGYNAALKAAKERGESVGEDEILAEELADAVDKFSLSLTNKDFQIALGMTTAGFHSMGPERLLKAMHIKTTSERLNKDGVDRMRCAYVAVRAWLEKTDRLAECDDGVPGYLLLEYLSGVKEEGQKNRGSGQTALAQSVFADEAMAVRGPAPRVGTLLQTGHSCGEFHRRGIQDLCKLFNFKWKGANIKQNFRIQGKSDRVPQAAQPPTIRMVVMLERFVEDDSNSIVLRHLASGYLLCCFGSLRVGNAQRCWIPYQLEDVEMLAGFVVLDKNPKRGKARPRLFWAPCRGATGSTAWLEVLRETLREVSSQQFIFRAFDGDVFTSNTFLPGPLREGLGLVEALQATLRVACGLSIEESRAYTLHSPRHFMPEVSSSRDEPVAARNEVGRWAGSAAQDDTLMPRVSETRMGSHTFTPKHMADIYAQKPFARIPITILGRQMTALRTYVSTVERAGTLPAYGGWDDIPKFAPLGGA